MKRAASDFEARAVTAGANAFDLGVSDCPYADQRARFWRLGWVTRKGARERWDAYPDRVEAMVAKAAPFIDRATPAGQMPKSKVLLLGFYSTGSHDPDAAFAYIERNLALLRQQFREQHA